MSEPSPVTIRTARPDDAAALIALLVGGSLRPQQETADDPSPYRAALVEIAATPGCTVLVAEADGQVVGMVQVITFRHLQHRGGRCAELESMHVARAHRSRGIGGQLLAAAATFAKRQGCYRIQLTSNAERPDAHRFYERYGFQRTHEGFKLSLA